MENIVGKTGRITHTHTHTHIWQIYRQSET